MTTYAELGCQVAGVGFDVTVPSPWDKSLPDYLGDYLPTPSGPMIGRYRLHVIADDQLLADGHARIAGWPKTGLIEAVPGVYLSEHADLGGDRGYLVIADTFENRPGSFAVTIRNDTIHLYCGSNGDNCRYALRIMREVALRAHENNGDLAFHAAAVDTGSTGVMICGAAGSGKTTTMTVLLHGLAGSLLSNDRVLVSAAGLITSLPLVVSAGKGTLHAFSELADISPARMRGRPAVLAELPDAYASPEKLEIAPRDYAAAFQATLINRAPLGLVLVPRFSDSGEPAQARPLPKAEAEHALRQACFTPADEFWIRPWLIGRHVDDRQLADYAADVCTSLAAAVECVEIRFGIRAEFAQLQRAVLETIR